MILIKNGKKRHSLLLEADGKHLMTDVWTSVGVLVGIGLVKLTGLNILDPIIAVIVALNIIWTGVQLLHRSGNGLMDSVISPDKQKLITNFLESQKEQGIEYHSLMTRQAGQRIFISLHLLVPGSWSVQKGHDKSEYIEEYIENLFELPATCSTHIEPIEDPASLNDIGIDRKKTIM
ncbi:MAG: Cation efflux protein (Precursor) [Bacteroidetes bacterium]|nr:Cation efflux protein (Precursor) [Bacteroidota bacterium]